jgi:hypothetical protein
MAASPRRVEAGLVHGESRDRWTRSSGVPVNEPNPAYPAFIESELKAERDRKTAIDTRGGNLVASSSTLFALLAGLASVGKAPTASVPAVVPPLLILALSSYFVAALLGIAAQWNRKYEVTTVEGLELLIGSLWSDDADRSRRRVASRLNAKSRPGGLRRF